MKKGNTGSFAAILTVAMIGLARAQAETMTITSEFTPLEDLSVEDRAAIIAKVDADHSHSPIDWENVIIGKNGEGIIEIRDKNTLQLKALSQPTCQRSGT